MKYNVTVQVIVNVHMDGVEAASREQAIDKALADPRYTPDSISHPDLPCDATTEVDGFLVDEAGDEKHERSQWYDKEGRPV